MQNNSTSEAFKASYADTLNVDELYFNFDNLEKSKPSLANLDALFLLRPPHISDTRKYFQPMIDHCVESQVHHICFFLFRALNVVQLFPITELRR
ncbi:MAG TPA: hypothetical protein VF141_01495 [Chryseolinea sp.]